MCSVRAHNEKKLEEHFVRVGVFQSGVIPEMSVAILCTDLTEFAWPIGEDTGKAGVRQIGVGGAPGAIEAAANGPAAIQAVIRGGIHAKGMLCLERIERRELIAIAPEEFGAEKE